MSKKVYTKKDVKKVLKNLKSIVDGKPLDPKFMKVINDNFWDLVLK